MVLLASVLVRHYQNALNVLIETYSFYVSRLWISASQMQMFSFTWTSRSELNVSVLFCVDVVFEIHSFTGVVFNIHHTVISHVDRVMPSRLHL